MRYVSCSLCIFLLFFFSRQPDAAMGDEVARAGTLYEYVGWEELPVPQTNRVAFAYDRVGMVDTSWMLCNRTCMLEISSNGVCHSHRRHECKYCWRILDAGMVCDC
jgi:hypothetical protein